MACGCARCSPTRPASCQGVRLLVVAHDVVIQLARALIEGFDERGRRRARHRHGVRELRAHVFERERGGGPRLDRHNWTVPVREQGEPETRSEDAPVGR